MFTNKENGKSKIEYPSFNIKDNKMIMIKIIKNKILTITLEIFLSIKTSFSQLTHLQLLDKNRECRNKFNFISLSQKGHFF